MGGGQPLINEVQSTVALFGVRYMNLLSDWIYKTHVKEYPDQTATDLGLC